MSFHEQLRKARLSKALTQQQVADLIGVTCSAYSCYEAGKRQPDPQKIRKLAKIFDVSADDLLELSPPKYISREEDIKFALFGGDGEITEDMYEEVKRFATFVKMREWEKNNPK